MKFLTNIRRQRQYLTISEPISDLDPKVVAAIKAQHQQKSTSQTTQPTNTTSTTPRTSASGTSPSGATSSYSSQTVANDTSTTSTSSPLNCIGVQFHPKSSASGSKGSVCVSKDGTHTTTSNTNTNTITTSLPNSPNSPNSPILTTPPSKKITHFRSSTTGSNSSGHTPNTEALTPSISEESKHNRIRLDSSTSTSAHRDGTPLTTDPSHHTHHTHHHNDDNYAEGYDDDDNFIIHMSHLQVPFDDVANGGGGGDMNTGTTHSGGHQGLPPIGSAGTTSSTSKTSIHSQNTSVSSNNSSNHSHNLGHNPPQLSSSEEAYLAGQSAGHPILPKNHKGMRLPSPTNLNAKYSSSSPTNSNSGMPTGTNATTTTTAAAAGNGNGNGTKNSGKSGKTTSGDNDIMEAGKSSRKGKTKSRNRIMGRKSSAVPKKLPSYMDGDGDGTNNNNHNDTKHKKHNANSNGGGGGGKVEQREGKVTAASSTKKKIGNLFAVGKKKAYKSSAPVPSPAASAHEVIPEQTPIDLERSGHTSTRTHRLDLDPSAQTAAEMQLQPPNPPLRRSKSKIKDFNENQINNHNNHNNHNDDDNEDEEDDLDKTLNPDILSVVSDITEPTYMNYYDDASTAFFMSTHCKKKFLDVRKKLYESLKARRDAQEQQAQQNAPNNDAHCRRGSWHGMGGTGTGTGANGKDLGKDGLPTPESILELLVDVLCSPQTPPPPPPPPPPPLHSSSQEQQQQQEQSHEQYHNYTSNVPTGMGAAAVNGAIPPPPPTAIIQVPTATPKSLPTKEIHLGTNINSNHGVGYNGQPQQHDGGVINRNQLQTRSMSMPDLKNKGIYDNSTPPPPSQYQQPQQQQQQQQQQSEKSAQVPPLPQVPTGTFSSRRYPTKNPTTTTKGVANSKSNGRKMSAHARY